MVELAERGDFAAARALHARLLPLMQVNFVESNPIPVKSAMATMGLLEEVYRLPMVPPRRGLAREDPCRRCAWRPGCWPASQPMTTALEDDIASLIAARQRRRRQGEAREAFARCARRCRPARSAPPSPTRRRRAAGA